MIYETFVCRQSHRTKDRTLINVAAENNRHFNITPLKTPWFRSHAPRVYDTEKPEPYRDRVATTEVQNAWSSRDSRRLQIVPGSALAGNSNCKNRVTELRFLVISRQ